MENWIPVLPHLQAGLNGAAMVLMIAAYRAIRAGNRARHKALMLAAVGVSGAFLASYLVYHFHVGNVKFAGAGWVRPLYFGILISHVVLAAAAVPMILTTVFRGLSGRLEGHRSVARKTLPIWLYVSFTGVVVYWMAYHLFPSV